MDGIHDLGGKQGHGAIDYEVDEPVFHGRWEARVFAMLMGLRRSSARTGTLQNTDQFRHAIERIDPVAYLTHTYYGRWLGGIENLLVEAGVITQQALTERVVALGGDPAARVAARPAADAAVVGPGTSRASARPLAQAPRFAAGDQVVTRRTPVVGHTRLPAYARGASGRIVSCHQGWVLPDSNAHGHGEQPEHLYTVAFSGETLWGPACEPGVVVNLDLFESYLEPV